MKFFCLGDVDVRWVEAYLSSRVSRVRIGGEPSEAIPMHSGSVIDPRLFLFFVNDAVDVKMVTRRTQSTNLYISLTVAWDWSKKWDLPTIPTTCKYLAIGREAPLRLSFLPVGLAPLSL